MRNFQKVVCLSVLVIGVCASAHGQNKAREGVSAAAAKAQDAGAQVVVDKDEFSGATTVKMAPQKLIDSPAHQLTMAAEVKLEGKTDGDVFGADETVLFKFDSQNNGELDFGDEELHFLVDQKPVKGGPLASAATSILFDRPAPGFKHRRSFIGGVSRSQLQQIAQGKTVAMRLGAVKLTLEEKTLRNLREFVRVTNRQ